MTGRFENMILLDSMRSLKRTQRRDTKADNRSTLAGRYAPRFNSPPRSLAR